MQRCQLAFNRPPAWALLVPVLVALGWTTPCSAQPIKDRELARVHYDRAKESFLRKDYRAALADFEDAHRLAGLPGLLFNIGQCHRSLNQPREAIATFRRYLREVPNATNRAEIEKTILELKEKAKTKDKQAGPTVGEGEPNSRPVETEPVAAPTLPPENNRARPDLTRPLSSPPSQRDQARPFYAKWWFWSAVAVAVSGATVGVYFAAKPGPQELPASSLGVLVHSR